MTYNSNVKKYSVKYVINKIHVNELKVNFNMDRVKISEIRVRE